ncbi:hypothetical protein AS850_03070 [Frondihabitans sp. 762G35]|uniref:hypothetical protein n=1 Tax=Frondihabitans sp. 762G35 TaxID=1446794 RepID=UPI000D210D7A|nr:hypothetical protein [Frondihabitans sp. 762G35]ARC56055.1 hypothetical protein AS850_03070 [Frondihabitans sp. 762G35]
MKKRSLFTVGLVALGLTMGPGAVAANAASVPSLMSPRGACDTSKYFNEVSSSTHSWKALMPKYSTTNNTPNAVETTFTVQQSGSYGASLSGTIEGGITAGIATAKASVTASITKTVTWTTSVATKTTVPAHSSRYAQYGTTAYKVYINKVHYSGNCTRSVVDSGTLTAPSTVGWVVTTS